MDVCIKKKNEVTNVNGKEGSYYIRKNRFKSTLGKTMETYYKGQENMVERGEISNKVCETNQG